MFYIHMYIHHFCYIVFNFPVAVWYLENLRRERSCRRVKVFRSPSRGCVRQSVTPSRQILQPVLDDYCRQNVPFVTSCCVSTTSPSLPSPKKVFYNILSSAFCHEKGCCWLQPCLGTFMMMYLMIDVKGLIWTDKII